MDQQQDGTQDPQGSDQQPAATDNPGAATEPDWKAEAEKWKALSRKHEGASTKAQDELKRLKAEGDSSKTDIQKLTETVAGLQTRAEAAELKALKAEVAQAKGLSASQGKFLAGATQEELEASADELLEAFKPAPDNDDKDKGGKKQPAGRPQQKLRGGTEPESEAVEMDPRKLASKIHGDK